MHGESEQQVLALRHSGELAPAAGSAAVAPCRPPALPLWHTCNTKLPISRTTNNKKKAETTAGCQQQSREEPSEERDTSQDERRDDVKV